MRGKLNDGRYDSLQSGAASQGHSKKGNIMSESKYNYVKYKDAWRKHLGMRPLLGFNLAKDSRA